MGNSIKINNINSSRELRDLVKTFATESIDGGGCDYIILHSMAAAHSSTMDI